VIRTDVVRHVAEVVSRYVAGDPQARVEWAQRHEWASPDEVRAGLDAALDGVRELLAEWDRMRQADIDSGLDDWAFCFLHAIAWDS
jgi:hypothetical protein